MQRAVRSSWTSSESRRDQVSFSPNEQHQVAVAVPAMRWSGFCVLAITVSRAGFPLASLINRFQLSAARVEGKGDEPLSRRGGILRLKFSYAVKFQARD